MRHRGPGGVTPENVSCLILDKSAPGTCRDRLPTNENKPCEHRDMIHDYMLDAIITHRVIYEENGRPVDSRIIDVNQAFERIINLKRDQIVGMTASQIFGEVPEDIRGRCYKVAETGISDQFEYQFPLNDSCFDMSVFSAERGTFTAVAHDVTNSRRAQDLLRSSEEKYRLLFENAREAIFVLQDGFIKFSNPKTCEITGYTQEKLKGSQLVSIIHRADQQAALRCIARKLDGEADERSNDYRIIDCEGRIKWIETTYVRIEWEERPAVLVFADDVTERIGAEDALCSSERRFRIAAELASDVIYEWDMMLNYTEYYGNIDGILGYNKNEFPRSMKAWAQIIHPDDLKRYVAALEAHFKAGQPFDEEYRVTRKDGRVAYLANRGRVITDEYGKPNKWVGVISDITQRKREEYLRNCRADYLGRLVGLTDCHEIAELTYAHIRNLMPCDAGALMMLHGGPNGDKFEIAYNFDTDEKGTRNAKSEREYFEIDPKSISAGIFRDGQRVILHRPADYITKVDWESRREFIFNDRPSLSLAFLPLRIHGRTVGVLSVQSYAPGAYNDEQVALLESVIADLTMALIAARSVEGLKNSEMRYRTLFDNMLEGLAHCQMIFDDSGSPIDWVYLDVNNAFERITGLKNITGHRVTEALPGIKEATPELFEIYGRVAVSGTPEVFEIDFTPLSSWFHISVYCPSKGFFVAVFEDITERKRAEKAIRESEIKFRSIFESVQDGIGMVDMNGRFLDCNPAFLNMVGYDRNEIEKVTFSDITPKRWHELESSIFADQIIARGYSDIYEKEYIRKDGSVFPIAIRSALIKDSEGKPVCMVGIVRDITDLRKAVTEPICASELKAMPMP